MRSTVAAVLGLVLAASAVLPPGTARAVPAGIDWQPCPDVPDVLCATLDVPLDWSEPDGPTTRLALAMRPATDPSGRLGSIVLDPGGPGGSGVNWVKSDRVVTEPVYTRFDLVGFDPRGIAGSEQVRCDRERRDEADAALHPTSQAEFDRLAAANRRLMDSCREHTGALVDHVDTRHKVRDLEAIRVALGGEKLNFLGYSYGTLLGQQYAEQFPDRIRTMVNDANTDHSQTSTWGFLRDETEAMERNFVEFARWCDATTTCALYGSDTRKVYGELKRRARAGTLTDPATGQVLDFYALSYLAFRADRPEGWRDLAENLRALRDGTGTVTASATAPADLVNASFTPIWCAEWPLPVADHAAYDRLRTTMAKRFPNVEWTPYMDNVERCVGDPVPVTNPPRRLEVDGAPPLVMIGTVHDAGTPYRWSRTAARQSGSHLVTYEGWGHNAYYRVQPSTCVTSAVEAYFVDLTVPRNLSCPSVNEP